MVYDAPLVVVSSLKRLLQLQLTTCLEFLEARVLGRPTHLVDGGLLGAQLSLQLPHLYLQRLDHRLLLGAAARPPAAATVAAEECGALVRLERALVAAQLAWSRLR